MGKGGRVSVGRLVTAAVLACALTIAAAAPVGAASGAPADGTAHAAKKKKCKKGGKKAGSAKKRCGKRKPPPDTVTPVTPDPPQDTDGDGVLDGADNCVSAANADQSDGDGDGKGDACDTCPAAANPGAQGCPASIYDVNMGNVPTGSNVRLTNVRVTAVAGDSVWVQVPGDDPGYVGLDYGGLEIDVSGTSPPGGLQAGNRVTIDGTTGDHTLAATAMSLTSGAVEPPSSRSTSVASFLGSTSALDGQLVDISTLSLDSHSAGAWNMWQGFVVAPRIIGTLPSCLDGVGFAVIVGLADNVGGNLQLLPRANSDIDLTYCSP